MSTFNEKEIELRQSMESILNQTYQNLEIIIVSDNPENSLILKILREYESKDSRVKILINDINLGLPRSLNRGIQEASGKYIARMDADDISFLDRIEKQVMYLEKNKICDVVGSNRIDIDEFQNIKTSNYKAIEDSSSIKSILPYGSVIVHPSVLIRKEVLNAVNSYREFDAAQDYDLWLRLITSGYKINILPEKLIYYRIRDNSITVKNPFKQYLFSKYAKRLFLSRKKNGKDNYSEENKIKFLRENGFYNPKVVNRFNKGYNKLFEGIGKIKKGEIQGLFIVIYAVFIQREIVRVLYSSIRFKLKLKNIYKAY